MTLPHRRSSRPRGHARLAIAGDFPDTGESVTDIIGRPADWDGTTITFGGASSAGLPDDDVIGNPPGSGYISGGFGNGTTWHPGQYPPARGGWAEDRGDSTYRCDEHDWSSYDGPCPECIRRERGHYFPAAPPPPAAAQPSAPAGYRFHPGGEVEEVFCGLFTDPAYPGFGLPPCGHCGGEFEGGDPALLCWERPLERLRYLAYAAGWIYDSRCTWTCPPCQASPAWQSLHRTLDIPGGPRAAAALAVGVMLASHDYPDILRAFDRKAAAITGGTFQPARWAAGPRHAARPAQAVTR